MLTIFLVEDNAMYSFMLSYKLKDAGYNFINYESGEEFLNDLHLKPDMVILDYSLPGTNGLEVLEKIKNYDEELPVVIISSQNDVKVAHQLLLAGADDYIVKDEDAVARIMNFAQHVIDKKILRDEIGFLEGRIKRQGVVTPLLIIVIIMLTIMLVLQLLQII